MSPARRTSILLLVLAALAGLFGIAMIAAAPKLATTAAPTPQLQERLDEFRRESPFSLQTLFVVAGLVTLAYAVTAATLGILVRNAGRPTAIVTLVLAGLIGVVTALQAGVALLMGSPSDALFSVVLTAAHAVVVKWMIQTLRRPVATRALAYAHDPARKPPLADYYLPPLPPA